MYSKCTSDLGWEAVGAGLEADLTRSLLSPLQEEQHATVLPLLVHLMEDASAPRVQVGP